MLTDWRGTPIEIGSPVLYATGAGSSKQVVEGEIVATEPRIKVRVIRRSSGYGRSRDIVTMYEANTLTVLESLPEFFG